MEPNRRWLLLGTGALLLVTGGVWASQGAGYLGGSFMTDERRWLVAGVATALIGLALIYRGVGHRR